MLATFSLMLCCTSACYARVPTSAGAASHFHQSGQKPVAKRDVAVVVEESNALRKEGKFDRALEKSKEAVERANALNDLVGRAFAMCAKAKSLEALKDSAGSIVSWKAASADFKDHGDIPEQVEALGNVVRLMGKGPGGDEAVEELLAASQAQTSRRKDLDFALWRAGEDLYDIEDLPKARRVLVAAARLTEINEPETLELAKAYQSCTEVSVDSKALKEADEWCRKELALRERLQPQSETLAARYFAFGSLCYHLGNKFDADDAFKNSLSIYRKVAPGSLKEANCLANLGLLKMYVDAGAADAYFHQALKILQVAAPASLTQASVYNNLGLLASARGDIDGMEYWLQKALDIKEKVSPGTMSLANTYTNLGLACEDRNRLGEAEQWFNKALDIRVKLEPDSYGVANSYANLSSVAQMRRDFAGSALAIARAISIYENLQPGSATLAKCYATQGWNEFYSDRVPSAITKFKAALTILEKISPNSMDHANVCRAMATAFRKIGKPEEAVPFAQRALDTVMMQGSSIKTSDYRQSFFAKGLKASDVLALCLLDAGQIANAFESSNVLRGTSLAESLSDHGIDLLANAPENLKTDLKRLMQERSSLYASLATKDFGQEDPSALYKNIAAVNSQVRDLRETISAGQPRLRNLYDQPEMLNVQSCLDSMDEGTLLMQYVLAEDEIILFTLLKTSTSFPGQLPSLKVHRTKISQERLAELANTFRSLLAKKLPYLDQGKELYSLLVKPAEPEVFSSKRVLLSPQGPLNTLPFAALVKDAVSKNGHVTYFSDLRPLHQIVSMSAYRAIKANKATAAPYRYELVMFGDPVYKSRNRSSEPSITEFGAASRLRDASLGELPYSAVEVNSLSALYGSRAKSYVREHATVENVLSKATDGKMLHFACHGLLDALDPAGSGLALTSSSSSSGILQAYKIVESLKLRSDLVTLSACETGLGVNTPNEGVHGLTRAFHYAGARSVLVSLWSISDRSTATFMKSFYGQHAGGVPKDQSLQTAAKSLRKDPRFAHPFYWAPFMLSGDWK